MGKASTTTTDVSVKEWSRPGAIVSGFGFEAYFSSADFQFSLKCEFAGVAAAFGFGAEDELGISAGPGCELVVVEKKASSEV